MNQNLRNLRKNNPEVRIDKIEDFHVIRNLWGDDSIVFKVEKGARTLDLANIKCYPTLVGVDHIDQDKLEFIFTPRDRNDPLVDTTFDLNYNGNTYRCSFGTCSDAIKCLAKTLRVVKPDTVSGHRNLRDFRSYFRDDVPDYVKKYNEDKVPLSFYIEGPLSRLKADYIPLLKTLNFYMAYFDRSFPQIVFVVDENLENTVARPCYSQVHSFPEAINAAPINEIILDIFNVASKTKDLRLRFIFYYQIIEFCTYYFLEGHIDTQLQKILREPKLPNNPEEYSKRIQELMQDYISNNRSDSSKIEKCIKHYVSIEDLEIELVKNAEYFAQDIQFEGGLTISKLFENPDSAKQPSKSLLLELKRNIDKIRNTVVHLRHSKENAVILPTKLNSEMLKPYLYVVRRIAEKIAIQFK